MFAYLFPILLLLQPEFYLFIRFISDFFYDYTLLISTIYTYLICKLRSWVHYKCGVYLKSMGSDLYELEFWHESKKYKMRFPKSRGPRRIIKVLSNNNDVTQEVFQYIGPSNNFYGIKTTPKMLGYDRLNVYYRSNVQAIYDNEDVIVI